MARTSRAVAIATIAGLLALATCEGRKELSTQAVQQLLGLGSQCSEPSQCSSPEGELTCVDGLCACDATAGYAYDDKTKGCKQLIDFLCGQGANSQDAGTNCFRAGDCVDESGYVTACPKDESTSNEPASQATDGAPMFTLLEAMGGPISIQELNHWLEGFHQWRN